MLCNLWSILTIECFWCQCMPSFYQLQQSHWYMVSKLEQMWHGRCLDLYRGCHSLQLKQKNRNTILSSSSQRFIQLMKLRATSVIIYEAEALVGCLGTCVSVYLFYLTTAFLIYISLILTMCNLTNIKSVCIGVVNLWFSIKPCRF